MLIPRQYYQDGNKFFQRHQLKLKVFVLISLLSVDFSSIDYIRKNHLKITNTIIVEIISIKKTETGYYCQFQDNSGSIFGTLNK